MSEQIDPEINTLNAPFWDAAAKGTLLLPHCVASGKAFWPPSPLSPFATNGAVDWQPVAPAGTLRSVITYRRGFQKALADLLPYRVGLVELAAGVRLQAYWPGEGRGADPKIGETVRIMFAPLLPEGRAVPTITGS
jgi:uncharacterized OB-fold protein